MLKRLQTIPGVGKAISRDLWEMGYRDIAEMRGQDPEAMYEHLCKLQGVQVDRCMLYVFRLCVYYAETPEAQREPERLKWWNWKDK